MKGLLVLALLLTACTCNRSGAKGNSAEPQLAAEAPTEKACAAEHVMGHRGVCARYSGVGWACLDMKKNVLNAEPKLWTKPEQKLWQGWPDRYERLWVGNSQACGQLASGGVECHGPDYSKMTDPDDESQFRRARLTPDRPKALNIEGRAHWVEADGVYAATRESKRKVPTSDGLSDVLGGRTIHCAWDKNRVLCWGIHDWMFPTGDPKSRRASELLVEREQPVTIGGIDEPIKKVALSYSGCALTEPGNVYCWGEAYNRGDGKRELCTDTTCPHDMRVATKVPIAGVTDLAWAVRSVVALKGDGSIWRWGWGLGLDGPRPYIEQPEEWKELGRDNERVLGSHEHGCAVKADGALVCWGKLRGSPWPGFSESAECGVDNDCPPTQVLPACVGKE